MCSGYCFETAAPRLGDDGRGAWSWRTPPLADHHTMRQRACRAEWSGVMERPRGHGRNRAYSYHGGQRETVTAEHRRYRWAD